LTVWFEVVWLFATSKQGISAKDAQRQLEVGSYATAWEMCHRLRSVLVRPGRELLAGGVEVDEAFIGGPEPGLAGGRARGKKALVVVAVETRDGPSRLGRTRLKVLPDASAASLTGFIEANLTPGAEVVTDAWSGYLPLASKGYTHRVVNQSAAARRGEDTDSLLPGVHRVISLVKRWLLGTHQGAVSPDHLQAYLDEYTFRFNRRASTSPGLLFLRLLQLAVAHDPVRRRDIIAQPTKLLTPHPGAGLGITGRPPTLERPIPPGTPWRQPI